MTCRRPARNARPPERERGVAILEFMLVTVFLVPLLFGAINVGTSLGRMIQATQVARDAGHMYVRQVDFSIPANRQLLVRLTSGMKMTATGGQGVIVLTRVMMVGPNECAAAGLTLGACTNLNQPVITQRLVVGNTSLHPSAFGTPLAALLGADGSITPDDYCTQSSARATSFGGVLTLQPAEFAYVAETYFEDSTWSLPSPFSVTGVYARNIF